MSNVPVSSALDALKALEALFLALEVTQKSQFFQPGTSQYAEGVVAGKYTAYGVAVSAVRDEILRLLIGVSDA